MAAALRAARAGRPADSAPYRDLYADSGTGAHADAIANGNAYTDGYTGPLADAYTDRDAGSCTDLDTRTRNAHGSYASGHCNTDKHRRATSHA